MQRKDRLRRTRKGPPHSPLFYPLLTLCNSTTGLFKLPVELIQGLLKELHDFEDLLSFVMANQTLYSIGFKFVQEAASKVRAPCTGNRLVCMGDYTLADDLPPGCTTKPLKEFGDEFDSFYDFASETFGDVPTPLLTPSTWQTYWAEESQGSVDLNSPMAKAELSALSRILESYYPLDSEWVLCNLTKREYVTANAVSECTGVKANGPFFEHSLGFGDVLMSLICWSSDPSTNMEYDGPIHRGAWAANSFKITTVDRLMDLEQVEGGKSGPWTDVSDEALELMMDIYEADFSR